MSSLRSFWSYTIGDGESLVLEPPYGWNSVLTQVAIADRRPVPSRVVVSASVETLLMDRPKVDGDCQSVQYEAVIASFAPNETPVKSVVAAFAPTDICFLQVTGAAVVVSGFTMKSALKLAQIAPE
jgi:hypothetical protein